MRILSEADVEALVSPPEAVALAAQAYRMQAAGSAPAALRGDLASAAPDAGCLLLAGDDGAGHLSVKSNVHAYPHGRAAARLWGSLLVLWDWRRAVPLALISARAFNDHRTAAGFAAGADRLAAPGATSLALFGAGKSAPMTLRYLKAVRPSLSRILLVGRSPERVAALAARVAGWPDFAGMEIAVAASAAQAAAEAEIIVTVTSAAEPVFPGAAVRPGACVVLGGANRPDRREADDALMRRAEVHLDSREGALAKAGDIRLALASGALAEGRIRGEIGALDGPARGFAPGSDVRVFKSIGLALQDALLAAALAERAQAQGRGQIVDLDGAAA